MRRIHLEYQNKAAEEKLAARLGFLKEKGLESAAIQRDTLIRKIRAQIRKVNAGLLKVDDEDQEIMDLGKNECAASMHGK